MTLITQNAPGASRASNPASNRHRADFARQAVIGAFGWRFAKALDQGDFVDRLPGEMPKPAPEARFR